MDFKDKIILCLVAMVFVLTIFLQCRENHEHEQKPELEPANDIIYNVVDNDGHVIGGFILKK